MKLWEHLLNNVENMDPEVLVETAQNFFHVTDKDVRAISKYEFDLLVHCKVMELWGAGLGNNYFHALEEIIARRTGEEINRDVYPALFSMADYKVLDFSKAAVATQLHYDDYIERKELRELEQ